MFDWLSPWAFLQTMARVAVVWLAFFGAGRMLRKPLRMDRAFPLVPSEIVGLLAFVLLTIPLSLLGVMNRAVCPVIIVLMAIPGALFTYGEIRDRFPLPKPKLITLLLGAFMLFVLLLNFTNASMPNLAFDDPLITYAVQPDRWLNRGSIYWLEETAFSGFPLLYEMTAVWPASLSTDRMNQLSVLQVFQMSLLFLAIYRGFVILKIGRLFRIPLMSIILLNTALYMWCSKAKTDTLALLFGTLAIVSSIRQKDDNFNGSPLSSWLYMGLTLAVKQTAVLILVPFMLYSAKCFAMYSSKWKILSIATLLTLPLAYGIRTFLVTGSPTYPIYPVTCFLGEGWVLNNPVETSLLNDRDSYLHTTRRFPILKHIGIYIGYMEGISLLFLSGLAFIVYTRHWNSLYVFLPMIVYSVAAIVIFWPPWWGAKYAIVAFVVYALIGVYKLPNTITSHTLLTVILIVSFIIPGFVAVAVESRPFYYRYQVFRSILSGSWQQNSGYGMWASTPEGMTHMWANSLLSDESVLFSIHEEKRYFFNGTVIVGWRHPIGQRIYTDNSLEDELNILRSLNVTHVGFYRSNPAPLEQETRLEILDHIGVGDILDPVISINGEYLLCKLNL